MDNTIKHLAHKTLLQNNIFSCPTYDDLMKMIEANGFTVVLYNKYSNSQYVTELIKQLKIENDIENNDSFFYLKNNFKFVFINEDISDKDKCSLLRHELGHILYPYLEENNINHTRIEQEEFANEFSYHIKNPGFTIKLRSFLKRKRTLLLTIIMLVLISSFFYFYKTDIAEKSKNTSTPVISATKSGEFYYVTSGGKKYHRNFCIIVKNRTNISEHTLQEVTEDGYKPCLLCIGPIN